MRPQSERTPKAHPICCDTKLSIQVYEKTGGTKWYNTPLYGNYSVLCRKHIIAQIFVIVNGIYKKIKQKM